MSNLVIWSLLGELILRTLDEVGDDSLTTEVERLRENHPIVFYIENALQTLFKPNGGLSCPELEKHILEYRNRNKAEFDNIIKSFIKEYYYNYSRSRNKKIPLTISFKQRMYAYL
ncbi:MAG: hypothetical protein DRJ52_02855 [Thermoprotei archaeon]|nr:MAG: hypothetical protein DRJ52_02855 [Thermoprotei archaeon]RLF00856.1 MAG: hypothetical protein DRJ63_01140 [Thermoprotei archaeon]